MASPTPPTEKVKKTSDKDLDLSNAGRGVWLVKVPKYIAERWESAPGGTEVGKLKIQRRAQQKPLVSLAMDDSLIKPMLDNDELEQKNAIPKDHQILMRPDMQTLGVFSHTLGQPPSVSEEAAGSSSGQPSGTPDKLALEGKVAQRAECRPIEGKTYDTMETAAIRSAIKPKSVSKMLKNPVNTYKPVSNHASNIAYDKRKQTEGKKSRDDKDHVIEILMSLFEKHQYYKINDLVKYTKQPVTYLKEVLKDVCNYNMKNPHKNMWELKPEYRHYKKDNEAEEKKEGSESDSD